MLFEGKESWGGGQVGNLWEMRRESVIEERTRRSAGRQGLDRNLQIAIFDFFSFFFPSESDENSVGLEMRNAVQDLRKAHGPAQ